MRAILFAMTFGFSLFLYHQVKLLIADSSQSYKEEIAEEKRSEVNTHSYLIATGEIDGERLAILNELYNPSSLSFLNITSGMHILTVGCGIGLLEIDMAKEVGQEGSILATDISPLQLEIAENIKRHHAIVNLNFQKLDIAHIDQLSEQFDRIHCRFVLSHLPWNSIEYLLPLLLSKLNSTGALIIEEISSLDSLICEPYSEEYEMWKSYAKKQFQAQGSDPAPGKRILEYLTIQGYNFTYQTHQPVLKQAREKTILALGIRSITQGLINKKIATPQEILETIARLKNLEQNAAVFPRYFEVSQFFIKAPNR